MHDPILEEIWRVREQLVQDHGGWDGYWRYIKKVEAEQRQRLRRRMLAAKARRAKLQKPTAKSGNTRRLRKSSV